MHADDKRLALAATTLLRESLIDRFYNTLKFITAIIQEEPVLIHVPARLDREAQRNAVFDLVERNRDRKNIIITSSFAEQEKIIWPSEHIALTVTHSGILLDVEDSFVANNSAFREAIIKFVSQANKKG